MPTLLFKSFKKIKTFCCISTLFFFISCASSYKLSYFMDLPNKADTVIKTISPYNEPKIKYADVLSLNVMPLDALSSMSPVTGSSGVSFNPQSTQLNAPQGNGYVVDKE